MTYGNPSLKTGVEQLMDQGVEDIIVLPLYPQYSGTTTAAAVSDGLTKAFKQMPVIPSYRFIRDYYSHLAMRRWLKVCAAIGKKMAEAITWCVHSTASLKVSR